MTQEKMGALGYADSGQMAVELAVLVPVVIVVALTVYNLMRFVELCAAFDHVALDAVISQGVSPEGEQSQMAAAEAVRSCIEEAMGCSACTVRVTASGLTDTATPGKVTFPVSPLLTRYTCEMTYRPWPGSFVIAGVVYASPFELRHERSLVVDRFRPGIVV